MQTYWVSTGSVAPSTMGDMSVASSLRRDGSAGNNYNDDSAARRGHNDAVEESAETIQEDQWV